MKFMLGLLAVLVAFGAATTFGREYDAALLARAPELDQLNALSTEPPPLPQPLSLRATRELLELCLKTKASVFYQLQASEQKLQIDQHCAGLAQHVVQRSPTVSAAHLTKAVFASTPADAAGPLVASQATAPFELWEARNRVAAGLGMYAQGIAELRMAIESDVAFLMQLHDGRAFLAQMYRAQAVTRPILTDLAESAPADQQARFLAELRRNVR
jgi:hypothetical protein